MASGTALGRVAAVYVALTVLGLSLVGTCPAHAQPPATPGATSSATLDARPLQRVLDGYLRDGRIDYARLSADSAARAGLSGMLDAAAALPETAPLSSWLNVYNAFVIELVLKHYPITSVMKVDGFFKRFERRLGGKPRSLDALEHGLIRVTFHDARVHFALNCAALGCPTLATQVFREADLDAQLEALTRSALSNPRHARLEAGTLKLSALFFWFEGDFVRDAGSVLAWLRRHAPAGKLGSLADGTPRAQLDYDWTLNDRPPRSPNARARRQ
jgi:hypothetical protein